ncbi:hypothetical protein RvY_12371-3 [Ramazzottius varieornatus]|uniref:Uncharacterized protein n=1 Tax=Ramazzottius varieornatus TaxID=947166 RepID=A0A1D1VNH0_RAMVA|nr:hypothetical protein RvY_12371-3 [Ramazzottius varieornatus]
MRKYPTRESCLRRGRERERVCAKEITPQSTTEGVLSIKETTKQRTMSDPRPPSLLKKQPDPLRWTKASSWDAVCGKRMRKRVRRRRRLHKPHMPKRRKTQNGIRMPQDACQAHRV